MATTQESHLLELNGENMIHWLAMGVAAQSVYVPFYPQGTKVPIPGKMEKKPTHQIQLTGSLKLASVLVDRNWGKYGTALSNTQSTTNEKLLQIRHQYDEKLTQEKDQEQQIKLVDEANAKLAKTATDAYKELIAKLITEQTGDSPLRFQMDPNL